MTRWLFLFGVTFDLVGAALIAWTINRRTADETAQEASSPFGGANLWIVVFRLREQAHVRAGLLVLAIGFSLQLAAYLSRFGNPTWIYVLAAAVVVAAATAGVAVRVASALSPALHYYQWPRHEGIADERQGKRVQTLSEVETARRLYASVFAERDVWSRPGIVEPRVDNNRWIFGCPGCGASHVDMATPGLATVVCSSCSGEYSAEFPAEREEIERLLLLRQPSERNWSPGESVEAVRLANETLGIPV